MNKDRYCGILYDLHSNYYFFLVKCKFPHYNSNKNEFLIDLKKNINEST